MCAIRPDGNLQIAEDDVLDALGEERVAVCPDLCRFLLQQVEDHGQIVDAEREQGVLVLADHAEVLAVRVDAQHVSKVARLDERLQRVDGRVVEEQVTGHQHELALLGEIAELLHLVRVHRRRLLDEHVLSRLQRQLGQFIVRGDRGRDDDRFELGVGQELLEVAGDAGLAGSGPRNSCRRSSSASQSQARSASSSKLRARFLPHAPRPACPSLVTISRLCRPRGRSCRSRCGSRPRASRPRPGARSRSRSGRSRS